MKKITLLIIAVFISSVGISQCINSTAYLTPTANNDGSEVTIGTCTYSTEYNTLSGLVSGEDYRFFGITNSTSTDAYVTITDVSDNVIAHGPSPLDVAAITDTTIRLHVTEDGACTGGSNCHTTGYRNITAATNACPGVENLTVSNLTTDGADLAWEESGIVAVSYNVEIYLSGESAGNGDTPVFSDAAVTGLMISVTGLADDTDYDAYVTTACSGSTANSSVVGPEPFTTIANCADVSNIAISNIEISEAQITWTAGNGNDSALVEVYLSGENAGNGNTAVYSNASATGGMDLATGLSAETVYDVYVTGLCGATTTNVQGPESFITACAAIAAPYSQDFETFTVSSSGLSLENCWSATNIGGYVWEVAATTDTSSSGTGPGSGVSDGNYLFTEATSGSQGDAIDLISPLVDLSALTTPTVAFDYHMFGGDMGTLEVIVRAGGVDTVEFTLSGQQQPTQDDPFTTAIVDLSAYAGQTVQVIFRGTKGPDFESDMAVDNVAFDEAPSCFDPSNLMVSNITDTTADLGWTAGDSETLWDIEIVDLTAAGTATGTPTNSGVGNPFTASGLAANNEYEFYVRADCGGGNVSGWVGPFAFTTECSAFVAPYSESFETFTVSSSGLTLENCWSATNIGGYVWEVAATTDTSSSGTGPGSGVSDGNYLFTEATSGSQGDAIDLISPLVDLSALTVPSVAFDYHMFGGDMGTLEVIVRAGGVDTVEFTLSGQQQPTQDDPFTTAIVDLSAYAGQTVKVIFRGTKGPDFESDMAVDNVVFDETPSCLPPSNLSASNIADTTADLGWTAGGSETLWDIEIVDVTASGTATGTPTVSGVANPYSASGLTSNNDYEFYVRADCGGGDVSDWVGPFAFTTECSAFVPDYLESFDSAVPPSCWEEAGAGDPTTGPSDFGSGLWNHDEFRNVGTTNNSAQINLYTNNREDWLISPMFDLSGGSYELVYTVALTDFANSNPPELNGMGSDDEVQVLISDDGGVSWTNLVTYNQSSYPSDTGDVETFDLSAYTGMVQFAIWATDGTVNDDEDYDFFIDEFIVRTPLACVSADVDSSTVVEDCANAQFYIDVDFTLVGDATQINDGTNTYPISGPGVLQVGPFTDGATVSLTVEHSDPSCNFVLADVTYICPPPNDLFANAITVSCDSSVSGTTIGATQDESDAPSTATVETDTFADNDSPWVWYTYTGSGSTEEIILSTCGTANTDFDTEIFVYTGTSGNLTLIDDGYDECGGSAENYAAETTFTSDGTTTYYIAIGGYNSGDIGNFQLNITCNSLSVNNIEDESSFTFYPNPVKNILTLNAQNNIENVTVFNMLGQQVLKAVPNSIDSELDMSNLDSGAYFVKVTIANITKTIRVIKQ